ncbi:MAG: hypothetical protein GSR84_00295 [Desulfurococcales archaeon]|nr:hypothetical protein [Desulfurococcales archaeon]
MARLSMHSAAITLLLIAAILAAPASAAVDITAEPDAPPEVQQLGSRIISFLLFLGLIAGLAVLALGIMKIGTGAEDGGRWIIRGLAILVGVAAFWSIVNFFVG